MKHPLLSSAIALLLALSFVPVDQGVARGTSVGCTNTIEPQLHSEQVANTLLQLPAGKRADDLWAIAMPTCTLEQTFGRNWRGYRVMKHSVYAYGIKSWKRCYVRVQLSWTNITEVRKVCL